MSVLVVGQGAVGTALVRDLTARKLKVCGVGLREDGLLSLDDKANGIETVIYAAGPAGDQACRKDPEGAFWAHYQKSTDLVRYWVSQHPTRRVILIGTVLTAGFYGAVKEVAAAEIQGFMTQTARRLGTVLHLRCGQVIGPEMPVDGTGVVATFARQAAHDQEITVTCERAPHGKSVSHAPGCLHLTLIQDLGQRIAEWLRAPASQPWEEERLCTPDVVGVSVIAAVCRQAAGSDQTWTYSCGMPYPTESPRKVGLGEPWAEAVRQMVARAKR